MQVRRNTHGNRRARAFGSSGPPPFNGNFASLFPGAYQVLQSDLGLTYGGTPLATAGNTSTTVLTLTGTLPTAPVPIWAKATNTLAIGAGAQFNIYYDGLGGAAAMVGVTPAVATPVALTGAATGLSVAWAAGSSVANDTWKATCAALADQSGNGMNALSVTATRQPVVGIGLNGKVDLLSDGVDDRWLTPVNPPAGSLLYIVFRYLTSSAFANVTDGSPGNICMLRQTGAANGNTEIYNGASLAGGQLPIGANGRIAAVCNGASSSIKVGANAQVNGNSGAFAPGAGGRTIGVNGDGSSFPASIGLFALIWAPAGSYAAADAALNTAAGYGPGSILV